MKKMLFVMLGVILAGYVYAQAPGAGTPTDPNALTINVLGDCKDFPKALSCESKQFARIVKEVSLGFSEVENLSCCVDSTPHHRGGTKGDEATSKPKPWCAKLEKTKYVDDYGFPKYRYPKSTEMMPPCISPVYVGDGPCCLTPEGEKPNKGGNRGNTVFDKPLCDDAPDLPICPGASQPQLPAGDTLPRAYGAYKWPAAPVNP